MSTREKTLPGILKEEQIEAAKSDRSHLAVQVFDALGAKYWEDLYESLKASTYDKKDALCSASIIPYAEALEGKLFSLTSTDIVSIWSRILEVFPDDRNTRYALSRAIAFVYATAIIDSEEWKHVSEFMHEEGFRYLIDLAEKDEPNAIKFRQRVSEINANLQELKYYAHGTREDAVALVRKADGGNDQDAKKRLEQAESWKRRTTMRF